MQLPAQKEQMDDKIISMSGFFMFTCILQHIFSLIWTIVLIGGLEAKIVIMKWTMRPQYLGRCLITGLTQVTRLTQRMPLVVQELLTLHPSEAPEFTPGFSGAGVTRFLVLCVWFVDRCLSFCPFSFGHCVVCPSSIYGFWLPLWYLVAPLISPK